MRLFLLSLLAIGSAQSLNIAYPYRSGLFGYNPARGEFPVQSTVVQDYLRYLDNNGNERLVSYSYPEPVYGIRQIDFSGDTSRGYIPDEFIKARDAHFRAWALQQYQALKCEINALRADGKEPSGDMLLKFQPLEKIALTADYSIIAELPEIKRIRDEHQRIWNDVRIRNLQNTAVGLSNQQSIISNLQGETKTYIGNQPTTTLVTVEETPEQKQAREEHLRIYNEQIRRQLELEQQHKETSLKSSQQSEQKENEAISELERANQEHLRLWNEAKLSAEQATSNTQDISETLNKQYEGAGQQQQQISALKYDQTSQYHQASNDFQKAREEHLRLVNEATLRIKAAEEHNKQEEQQNLKAYIPKEEHSKTQLQQQQQQIADTPEVIRAREEHLRLVNEATLRIQLAEQEELKLKQQSIEHPIQQFQEHITQLKHDSNIEQHTHDTKQETVDFEKARQEHQRLVNEATLKIQAAEEHIKQLGAQQIEPQFEIRSHIPNEQQQQQQQQVLDTPEVIRAREEHLRLVNEANLKAQIAEQQELKQQSQQEQQPISELKYDQNFQQHIHDTKQETIDFQKGQAQHLRLVDEATQKIKAAEEHIKQLEAQQITPLQTQTQSQLGVEQQSFKLSSLPTEQHQPQQVVETPEVMLAREEHLRLVNEANLKAQIAEQQELNQPIQFNERIDVTNYEQLQQQHNVKSSLTAEQQQQQPQQIVDTPEVMRAREDHLRLVHEANSRAQLVEQQKLTSTQESHENSLLKTQIPHQPIHYQQQQQQFVNQHEQSHPIQDTSEVIKAREEHLRLFKEAELKAKTENQEQSNLKSDFHQGQYQHQIFQHNIEETPEVKQAREEHLRIFNNLRSRAEREQTKLADIKSSSDIILQPILSNEDLMENIKEAERLKEDMRLLELEGMREAERLQEEHQQLELERLREAERLAQEQRLMKDELIRLQMDEEQRLEMERLDLEKLEKLKIEENKQSEIPNTLLFKPQPDIAIISNFKSFPNSADQSQIQLQQQYAHNPYLRVNPIQSGIVVNRLQHSFQQQQQQPLFTNNPFLRTSAVKLPQIYYPIAVTSNAANTNTVVPVVRYVQSQQSTGQKHQHLKDDFVQKTKYTNTGASQPADTAAAFRALEKATNEHFRAHELALEQLRLARLQNPQLKDCN